MAPKSIEHFKAVHQAFVTGDAAAMEEHAGANAVWVRPGAPATEGKAALLDALAEAGYSRARDIAVDHVITHGKAAAVNGTVTLPGANGTPARWAYCHIYEMTGFTNGKVKRITSYMIADPAPQAKETSS